MKFNSKFSNLAAKTNSLIESLLIESLLAEKLVTRLVGTSGSVNKSNNSQQSQSKCQFCG